MSPEGWTLTAAIVGALIGFGGTQIQSGLDRNRKLKAYARLLLLEELKLNELKLRCLEEGDTIPYLSLEVWKASRTKVAALLNDETLFGNLCIIARVSDEWNAARPDVHHDVWEFKRNVLLTTLDDSLPNLERTARWRPKKKSVAVDAPPPPEKKSPETPLQKVK